MFQIQLSAFSSVLILSVIISLRLTGELFTLGWTPLVMLKFNSTLRQKVAQVVCGKSSKINVQATRTVTVTKAQSVVPIVQDEMSDC